MPKPRDARLRSAPTRTLAAMVLVLVVACSRDASTAPSPVGSTPGPVPADSIPVLVDVGEQVTAEPRAGVHWVQRNSALTYAFRAAGAARLVVRVNDTLQATSSRLVITAPTRITAVVLPETSSVVRTSVDAQFDRLVSGVAPLPILDSLAALQTSDDSAVRARFDEARFRTLMRLGPDAYFALLDRISHAETAASARATDTPAAVAARQLQVATSGGRTVTVIFVNGILNGPLGAAANRTALAKVLNGGGLAASGQRSWEVIRHQNPIVRFDLSDPARCARELVWLRDAVGRGWSGALRAVTLRVEELLRQRSKSECLRTNLRVATDYLVQVLGGTSALNQDDRKLLALVEQRRAGGGNVLIVGHSQGAVISRNVLAQIQPASSTRGCVAFLGVGSPVQYTSAPNVVRTNTLIAQGAVPAIQDILYALTPGRTDGRASDRTRAFDDRYGVLMLPGQIPGVATVADLITIFVRLELHYFDATYAAADGYAKDLLSEAEASAAALEEACPAPVVVNKSVGVTLETATLAAARTAATAEVGIGLSNPNAVPLTVRLEPLSGILPPGVSMTLRGGEVTLAPRQVIRASDPAAPQALVTVQPGVPSVRVGLAVAASAISMPKSCGSSRLTVSAGTNVVSTGSFSIRFTGATPGSTSSAAAQVTLNDAQTVVTWQAAAEGTYAVTLAPGPNVLTVRQAMGTGAPSYRVPEPFGSDRWSSFGFVAVSHRWFYRTYDIDTSSPDVYTTRAVEACSRVATML